MSGRELKKTAIPPVALMELPRRVEKPGPKVVGNRPARPLSDLSRQAPEGGFHFGEGGEKGLQDRVVSRLEAGEKLAQAAADRRGLAVKEEEKPALSRRRSGARRPLSTSQASEGGGRFVLGEGNLGLVEWVDSEDGSGDGGGKLPGIKLPPDFVR